MADTRFDPAGHHCEDLRGGDQVELVADRVHVLLARHLADQETDRLDEADRLATRVQLSRVRHDRVVEDVEALEGDVRGDTDRDVGLVLEQEDMLHDVAGDPDRSTAEGQDRGQPAADHDGTAAPPRARVKRTWLSRISPSVVPTRTIP